MFRLADERRELEMRYEVLQNRIRSSQRKIDEIRHRDNLVYRPLFSSDTLSIKGIYTPYAEQKYAHLQGNDFSPMITSVWKEMDQLARSLYLESKSLDELQILSKDKEKFSTAIPAIWPIDRSLLRNKIGAFGYRMHPKLHRWKFHKGVDMAGRVGDPIFATGDGVVESVILSRARTGYGTQVVINHGFGYKTRYAHLNKAHVQRGDSIKRGQLIADLGNTGISTGPHLHYEVMYMGHHVNPINYINKNMSAEEFENIISSARETTYEAD
jgi:murein DD-endopeptidase MepM/ murein hydrolase activator NlpD